MEMTVVIAAIALLAVFSMPTIRALLGTFESDSGTKAMINAALSSARAIAAKHQRYAGVRFQKAYNPNEPAKASQYMIFIVHEESKKMGGLTVGFCALENRKPIKLPDSVGVADLMVRTDLSNASDPNCRQIEEADLDDPVYITDTSSFSIIFSPAGKLVIHDLRVRNRDGKINSSAVQSMDDVFNTQTQITHPTYPVGMFCQDDYADLGLGQEPSRNWFVVYDKAVFNTMGRAERYGYLYDLKKIYINSYTGRMISTD